MYGQSPDQRSVLIGQSRVTLSCPIVGDPYSASAYRTVSHNARADEALRVAPNAGSEAAICALDLSSGDVAVSAHLGDTGGGRR
jgi:hypothetical protein